jgi:hypothetical protein
VAQLLPIVVTPHRFRTRSQFWAYCGPGIVMRSSSDWVQSPAGGWVRARVQQTRGLNRKHNSTLENIFKGAATTIITQLHADPLYEHYLRLTSALRNLNLSKRPLDLRVVRLGGGRCRGNDQHEKRASNHREIPLSSRDSTVIRRAVKARTDSRAWARTNSDLAGKLWGFPQPEETTRWRSRPDSSCSTTF